MLSYCTHTFDLYFFATVVAYINTMKTNFDLNFLILPSFLTGWIHNTHAHICKPRKVELLFFYLYTLI